MPGGGNVFRFGPFELDVSRERLFRGTAPVSLSDPQTAILLHLVANVGEVVSKEALARAAWRNAAVGDNSLDKTISRLRKTLGSGGNGTRYIETVPSRGYRFVASLERALRHDCNLSIDAQLETWRLFVQGESDLNTLNRDAIVRARRTFEEVLRDTPDYPPACVGLANACALAYESTRIDTAPDAAALKLAVEYASKGCELSPTWADAWSTLAFVLCLNGNTRDAEAAACKAVDLDPFDWRHALRLSYVSWGEGRLRAARRVLTLCPGLALAHWLMGTVFIARQAFDPALEVLRQGCAEQDAQATGAAGFHAVGLHLLRGLALAAMGGVDTAVAELTREIESPHSGQLYARECTANTWYTLGALHHRQRRRDEAAAAFKQALTVVPGHLFAAAALGIDSPSASRPQDPNTIDHAVVQAIGLARAGRHPDAAHVCREALAQAPPGLAGWLLPAEPMLNPTARPEVWAHTLQILRDRAI